MSDPRVMSIPDLIAENAALRAQVEEFARDLGESQHAAAAEAGRRRELEAQVEELKRERDGSDLDLYSSERDHFKDLSATYYRHWQTAVKRAERAEQQLAEVKTNEGECVTAVLRGADAKRLELEIRLTKVVEALEDLTSAGCEFKDERVSYETWQIPTGSMERARAALAAVRAEAPEKDEKRERLIDHLSKHGPEFP